MSKTFFSLSFTTEKKNPGQNKKRLRNVGKESFKVIFFVCKPFFKIFLFHMSKLFFPLGFTNAKKSSSPEKVTHEKETIFQDKMVSHVFFFFFPTCLNSMLFSFDLVSHMKKKNGKWIIRKKKTLFTCV